MPAMIACCVPHCRRRRRADEHTTEWICADHWRTTDPKARQAYRRQRRRIKVDNGGPSRMLAQDAWEALKRQAVERAAGI